MAGFALPKLRWLLAGAAAAGLWAATQEPPRRAPRIAAVERLAESVKKEVAAVVAPRPTAATSRVETPSKALTPETRPAEMITSSIPRPPNPVAKSASVTLKTNSRVRLRAKAATSAAVVKTLGAGQAVDVLARDGKWLKVSVSGEQGWVHGDYVGKPTGAKAPSPKPKLPVMATSKQPAAKSSLLSKAGGLLGLSRKPARAPQGGDCQCPYDLMLNGSQCGDHSAYARQKEIQCYL